MSETTSEFLSDLAERIKASDAKLNAELADIMAGRPYKKRAAPQENQAANPVEKKAPAVRKPRAKRTTPPKAST